MSFPGSVHIGWRIAGLRTATAMIFSLLRPSAAKSRPKRVHQFVDHRAPQLRLCVVRQLVCAPISVRAT